MSMLEHALEYAKLGIAIIPLHNPTPEGTCSCGKLECDSVGKHPRTLHGLKDASIDMKQIKFWWKNFPNANIGMLTGKVNNVIAYDVDPRHGGSMESFPCEMPDTKWVQTGSNGMHLLFKYPEKATKIGNKANLYQGVDVRADGGYIVAPPSVHGCGNQYVINDKTLIKLALPEKLYKDLTNHRQTNNAVTTAGDIIPNGQRNAECAKFGGTLRSKGLGFDAILTSLVDWNKQCDPPLEHAVLVSTAKSVGKYPPRLNTPEANEQRDNTYKDDRGKVLVDDCVEALLKKNIGMYIGDQETQYLWDLCWKKIKKANLIKTIKDDLNFDANVSTYTLGEIRRQYNIATTAGFNVETQKQYGKLNLTNGVLDIETRELTPHDPKYMFYSVSPIKYNQDAECPLWFEFLETLCMGNEELITVLQDMFGYCLKPGNWLQNSFVLIGKGGTGKSTLLKTLMYVLGTENTASQSMGCLQETHKLHLIEHKLANISEEQPTDKIIAADVFKNLVSEGMCSANPKNKEPYEFINQAKMIFACNESPKFSDRTNAIYRRLILMPFEHFIKSDKKDWSMPQRFQAESSGILNWALDGLMRVLKENKITEVPITDKTKQKMIYETDNVKAFIDDMCVVGPEYHIDLEDIFKTYKEYCSEANLYATSRNELGKRLSTHLGDSLERKRYEKNNTKLTRYCGIDLLKNQKMPSNDNWQSVGYQKNFGLINGGNNSEENQT